MSSTTGTYLHVPGEGLVKVSEEIPCVSHREAWMPKGGYRYYDKSAHRWFDSKTEKRQWLKTHGMREGGIITNTDKRWEGVARNATKPSWVARHAHQQRQAALQAQGGTQGLLDRIQQGKGRFL
jgi:hypothetical protein